MSLKNSKANFFAAIPKDLRRSYKEIQRYNLLMLNNFSALTVPVVLMSAIVRAILGITDFGSVVPIITFMLVSGVMYIITKKLLDSRKYSGIAVHLLITVFGFFIYTETIYLDVFVYTQSHGLFFVAFLIAHQALYIMPLSWNLIMAVVPSLAFIISSVGEKTAEYYMQDISNVLIGLAAALIVNYITGKERVQLILAKERLARDYDELSIVNSVDALTGIFNKSVSEEKLEEYCRICANGRASIFAAIVDVDFFKLYNDTYGHPEGDKMLKELGTMLRELAEEYEIIAGRVGGEEFLLTGYAGSRLQATRICDKLRYEVQRRKIENKASSVAPFVTISVGVAFAEFGSDIDASVLYKKADDALYEAKRAGRNCVKTSLD